MLTDDQVIAKVRAAAEIVLSPAGNHGAYEPDSPEASCARAALAMVEQCEWHRREIDNATNGRTGEFIRLTHGAAARRIAIALRRAVGE